MRIFLSALIAAFFATTTFGQVVTTIAGTPMQGGHADGPAPQALFDRPTWLDVAHGRDFSRVAKPGDIFVTDRLNNVIRKISDGAVTTLEFHKELVKIDFGGPFGGGIVVESATAGCGAAMWDRGMFVSSSGTHLIRHLSPLGTHNASRDDVLPYIGIENFPGSRDALNDQAQFNTPGGITTSWEYAGFNTVYKQALYIADTGNHTIRRVRFVLSFEACPQHKRVETLAGRAGEAGWRDGSADQALFNTPRGVAAAPDGSVYVADSGNHVIRRIAIDGSVTTVAGEPGVPGSDDNHLNTPSGIAVNARGEVFIADTMNHAIRMLTTDGRLVTIAGTPGEGGYADGIGREARFAGPVGLRFAPAGALIVADTSNHVIRRIDVASSPTARP